MTLTELRRQFWLANPNLKRKTVKTPKGSRRPATQNEYDTDTRMAWCDFVESMRRNGDITEDLAGRATL